MTLECDALPHSLHARGGQVVFGVQPRFFSPELAGKYLGHSENWLRLLAKVHELFKPTVRGRGKGSPCFYDRDHLDLIADYLTDDPKFTEHPELMDEALMLWTRKRRNRMQRHFDEAK